MKEKINSALKFMRRNRTFTKLVSFILSVVMVFYVIPNTVYTKAAEILNSTEASDSAHESVVSDISNPSVLDNEYGVLFEDVALREESVKHFHKEDGTYVAAQYNYPIHTLDSNGEWQDIDNALSDSGSEFSNNNARIKFAKKINGSSELFALHDGNTKLTFTLVNAIKGTVGEVTNNTDAESDTELQKMMNLEKLSSSIIYRDILDGVDLEYVAYSKNVKENIIVKERKDSYTYTFELKLNGLTPTLTDSGSIEIYSDGTDEIMYVIPAPVVFDSNGVYAPSEISHYTLTHKNGKKYTLTVSVNSAWMNAEDRAFPVTVDPPILSSYSGVLDLTIDSSSPNSNTDGSESLYVSSTERAYLKFNENYFVSIPGGTSILKAELSIIGGSFFSETANVGVYAITTAWDNTLTWNKTIGANPQGSFSNIPLDYLELGRGDIRHSWDITELYESWLNGAPNYGIGMRIVDETTSEDACFTSNEYYPPGDDTYFYAPVIMVTYTYISGLEEYYPTLTDSAGTGGVGSINLSTGNLTLAVPTLSTTDSLFAFTPTLVYNSNVVSYVEADDSFISNFIPSYMPNGFKLNIQEKIAYRTYTNADGEYVQYYLLYDADGTVHAFYSQYYGGPYYDEDGLQLVMVVGSSQITITDADHNIKTYTPVTGSGYTLTSITDKFGNKLIIDYGSSNKPLKIKVKPSGISEIDMLSFVYDGDILCAVYNSASKQAVVLRYSDTATGNIVTTGEKYLRRVDYYYLDSSTVEQDIWNKYIDENSNTNIQLYSSAEYTYNALGNIIGITDNSTDISLQYEITNGKVTKISECAEDTIGQEVSYTYSNGYTDVRSTGNDEVLNTSDDVITRYIFDDYCRTVSVYSSSADGRTIYGAISGAYDDESNKNNLKHKAVIEGSVKNYLLNGDFEELDENGKFLHWTETSDVYRENSYPHSDEGYYAASLSTSSTTDKSISQVVFLEEGIYTLSMSYVSRACEDHEGNVYITSTVNSGFNHTESLSLNQSVTSIEKVAFSTTFEVSDFLNGGDYLEIKITFGGTATIQSPIFKIDNVMLCDSVGAADYSLVSYPGFEATSFGSGNSIVGLDNYWTNGDSGTSPILSDTGITEFGKAVRVNTTANESYVKQRIYRINSSSLTNYGTQDFVGNAYYDYIVSGFAYAPLAFCNLYSQFRLRVDVYYYQGEGKDDVVKSHYFDFLPGIDSWQFVSGTFSTSYIPTDSSDTNKYNCVSAIDIYCEYNNQFGGYALFDNISVIHADYDNFVEYYYYTEGVAKGKLAMKSSPTYEEYYAYDSNANLSVIATSEDDLVKYEYNNANQLVSVINCEYSYDSDNEEYCFPIGQEDPYSLVTKYFKNKTEYTYNTYGNTVSVVTSPLDLNSGDVVSGAKKTISTFTYDVSADSPMFGALTSETDSLGITVYYYYDSACRLDATVNSTSRNGLAYNYDSKGQLISVIPAKYVSSSAFNEITNAEKVEYTYSSDNMLEGVSTASTDYSFSYDEFGNRVWVKVGDNTLASYEYADNNGKLQKVTYGNGFVVEYVYNVLENLSEIWYTDGEGTRTKAYEYEYTADGLIHSVKDNINGKQTVYTYDNRNRLSKVVSSSEDDMYNDLFTKIAYYDDGNLDYIFTQIDLVENTDYDDIYLSYSSHYYGENNQLSHYNMSSNYVQGGHTFTYDTLYRLSQKTYALGSFDISYSYTYRDKDEYTSGYIKSVTTVINDTIAKYNAYGYNSEGNITSISYPDGSYVNYTYDKLGQLTMETNGTNTYRYNYDNAGNIVSIELLRSTSGGQIIRALPLLPNLTTATMGYTDSEWGDLLTSYNGTTITYDEIGNPLSYYNGSSYTFGWQGRRLVSAVKGSNTMSFTYNDEGIRTSKTVNGVTTNYYHQGSLLYAEETNSQITVYFYDENGAPVGFMYRGADYDENVWDVYAYEKNIQGDIVAVYDAATGTKLITYTYNAWGKITTSYSNGGASTTAIKNPYKYRGYYHDSDLNLYYLQSRYYDPVICRFINADSALYDNILGYNLFAYCYNNPVMYIDPTGCAPDLDLLFKGSLLVVIGGLTFASVVLTGGSCIPVVAAAYAAIATAAVATTTVGAFDVYESFTGDNPAKDFVGEETYETIKNASVAVLALAPAVISYGTTVSVCFVAGTLVKTESGDKSIENICVGDKVFAYNEETGEVVLKTVVNTFVNEAKELVHVFVNNEEIICTNEHPFYSPIKGWTEACKLRAGDILVSLNGEYVIVEQVQHEILENPVKVYNFEVEGFHTYFVGNGDGVLVHNDCGWSTVVESSNAYNTVKNFDKQQTTNYENALTKLASGNTSGLNVHRLTNGMYAADLSGFGKGRGAGRIIYQIANGIIEVFEVTVKHYNK